MMEPTVSERQARAELEVAPARPETPVWLQRLWIIVLVAFCIELGLVLLVLPWRSVWTTNSLVADHPALRQLLQNYFLRGAVTGLGLVDIWIGIMEAVRYRDRKRV